MSLRPSAFRSPRVDGTNQTEDAMRTWCWLLIGAWSLAAAAPAAADALRAPVYFAPHAASAARAAPQACGTIPAPVRSLELTGFYRADPAQPRQRYDDVDPEALARYQKRVEG